MVFGLGILSMANVAHAFFGNMMNPSRWFDDDDYYDRYGGRYGPYGYGPYGGHYGPYGPYGYGPYGYGGWGAQQPTIVVNPSGSGSQSQTPRAPE